MLLHFFSFLIVSIFVSSSNGVAWSREHKLLSKKSPCHSGPFSTYPTFLAGLSEFYGSIRKTSEVNIVQNRVSGLEIPYKNSSFNAYLCQDGYEIKGFSPKFLICSRIDTVVDDYLALGRCKCIKNLGTCPLPPPVDSSQEVSGEESEEGSDENYEGSFEEFTEDETPPPVEVPPPANYTTEYDCIKNGRVKQATVCSQLGIQGFNEFGLCCASSRGLNPNSCPHCLERQYCLGNQYVCGVLVIQTELNGGEKALGVICCVSTNQNTLIVPMENTDKNGNSASSQIEPNVLLHFERSGRTTFAGACVIEEKDYGFYFELCPADFFIQGFNGNKLICSKEIYETEVNYIANEEEECEQHICFPEDDMECIEAPVPKIMMCETSFVSSILTPADQTVCDGATYGNRLQDRGLGCDSLDEGNLCLEKNNGLACGVVATRYGRSWLPKGLIFCLPEQVPENVEDFAKENRDDVLYFYKLLQMERRTLFVQDDTSEMSLLFNEKIQDYMQPNEILHDYFSPIYKRRMWVYEELPVGGHYPETLIMCPNNTYVRGVQRTANIGDTFRLLCSEEAPFIEEKEVKLIGADTGEVCPSLTRAGDGTYFCGLNEPNELQYEFCGNGEYYAPINGAGGRRCHADPCGNNGGVCGSTNILYSQQLLLVCCEVHRMFPNRIPEAIDENGMVSNAAIKYVIEKLREKYQAENNGKLATNEEILSYYREKHELPRTLSIVQATDLYSSAANQAIESGETIPAALALASDERSFNYWIIDNDYGFFNGVPHLIRAFICPPNLFIRGLVTNGVLCSERVPVIGKRYTKILGAGSTCISTSNPNSRDYLYTCIFENRGNNGQNVASFCSRGYFGQNSLSDQGKCSDGFRCRNVRDEPNTAACGLLMVPGQPGWEKIICCNVS